MLHSTVTEIMGEVEQELDRAIEKFPDFTTWHEGYAVIKEELDELWDDIRANKGDGESARNEAIQIAAMAVRYALDLCGD